MVTIELNKALPDLKAIVLAIEGLYILVLLLGAIVFLTIIVSYFLDRYEHFQCSICYEDTQWICITCNACYEHCSCSPEDIPEDRAA